MLIVKNICKNREYPIVLKRKNMEGEKGTLALPFLIGYAKLSLVKDIIFGYKTLRRYLGNSDS